MIIVITPFAKIRPASVLLEVIVCILVSAVLFGILLPFIHNAYVVSQKISCKVKMKDIMLALHHFHTVHGCFPNNAFDGQPADIKGVSWIALTLPFVGEEPLWRQTLEAHRVQPLVSASSIPADPPHVGQSTVVKPFVCPADSRLLKTIVTPTGIPTAFGSFVGVGPISVREPWGEQRTFRTCLGGDFGLKIGEIADGTSQTLFFGERPPPDTFQTGKWCYFRIQEPFGYPDHVLSIPQHPAVKGDPCGSSQRFQSLGPGNLNNPCDRFHFWSLHGGGAHFAFVDGSVRFLTFPSHSSLIGDLATVAGGESVPLND